VAASFGALSGCGAADTTGAHGGSGTTATTASGQTYVIHAADVIVVGGGLAGMNAARLVNGSGASCIVVDKGPVGHSGNSGISWGHCMITSEWSGDDGTSGVGAMLMDTHGLLDQEHALAVVQATQEGHEVAFLEQAGSVFQRDDKGELVGKVENAPFTMVPDARNRQVAQYVMRLGIPVFDHMMMIDFVLSPDEGIAGIVAIDLRDGSAHLFRGKCVILATGGYHWTFGRTNAGPESTGEGHAALLRHGVALKDMEFAHYDFVGARPFGYRQDKEKDQLEVVMTGSIAGSIFPRVYNKDMQNYALGYFSDPKLNEFPGAAFAGTMITSAIELVSGKGTVGDGSGDGLYLDIKGLSTDYSFPYACYGGFFKDAARVTGYEFPDYWEMVPEAYGSGASPKVAAKTGETAIPNLYSAVLNITELSSMFAWGQGYITGKAAAERARSSVLAAFDPAEVATIIDKAYGALTATPPDGIRSCEVHRSIQRACYKGLGLIKDETIMQATLDELLRIQSEDLPKMYCADTSRQMNRDWQNALEVEGMLLCAIGSVKAALSRTETRPLFFRTDYPKMDNDSWLAFQWVTLGDDGSWDIKKEDIEGTLFTRDDIKSMFLPVDISIPNTYL
jgi:succinate dehydrogenase / fumarate reductase flavoprotein subunit